MKTVKFELYNNFVEAILLCKDETDALLLLPPADKYEIPCLVIARYDDTIKQWVDNKDYNWIKLTSKQNLFVLIDNLQDACKKLGYKRNVKTKKS